MHFQKVKSIAEFHQMKGVPAPHHPLISVIDYGEMVCMQASEPATYLFDFYNISIKRGINGKMKYGQQQYDFDNGVMFFLAPKQVFKIEGSSTMSEDRSGWMLLIHPDFLQQTSLASRMKNYEFFNYAANEALFVSDKEEAIINGLIQNIEQELMMNIDSFSQEIIISQIETLLNYSQRFYNRQFITRKVSNHEIVTRLERLLNDYFRQDVLIEKGLPTVQYVSDELNLSASYLSNVLKVHTGQSTQQHIHEKLIEVAKEKLSTTNLSVSEIAYTLGFDYPQSFSKLFKSKTNFSPVEFRASFN